MFNSRRVLNFLCFASLGLALARAAGAGDAPARPSAVAAGPDGSFFSADLVRPGLDRHDAQGRVRRFAPGGERDRTPLHAVNALAVGRDGTLFAADRATGEVYRVEEGKPPAPLSGGSFEVPTGLAMPPEGDLLVCDLRLGIVARVPKQGGSPATLARVPAPRGLGLLPSGEIVVLTMGPDQLVRVGPDGTVRPLLKGKPFRFPLGLVRDEKRRRWLVSDGYAATVWEVSDAGEPRPWIKGSPLVRPSGLALDSTDALLIADPGAGQVFRATAPDAIQKMLPNP